MFNSVFLSIAIALVFIFLLLAVMVTAINELVFTFIRSRARQLEFFLAKLYFKDEQWTKIFNSIKNSPFINVLKKDPDKFPSSIPASSFSTALLAEIGKNSLTIEAVRKAVEASKGSNSGFFSMLEALLSQNPTFDQLKAEIEKIFNSSMERLTGWYKYNAKIMSFIFALIICAGLNVDTITITRNLWNNKDKAEQLASFAAATAPYFEKNDSSEVVFKSGIDTVAYIKVENTALTGSKAGKAILKIDTTGGKKAEQQLVRSYNILANLDLPIGWTKENMPLITDNLTKNIGSWILKILGILLTTAAVALGAPFWFDILNRITPLKQAAGKTPSQKSNSDQVKDS